MATAPAGNQKQTITGMLDHQATLAAPITLREHRPGDIGWVVAQHGALYAAQYGWDATFEALVADIGAKFLRDFDPLRERCWIAESGGKWVGCVFVVKQSARVAKLRLLLIDPSVRGQGPEARLVGQYWELGL